MLLVITRGHRRHRSGSDPVAIERSPILDRALTLFVSHTQARSIARTPIWEGTLTHLGSHVHPIGKARTPICDRTLSQPVTCNSLITKAVVGSKMWPDGKGESASPNRCEPGRPGCDHKPPSFSTELWWLLARTETPSVRSPRAGTSFCRHRGSSAIAYNLNHAHVPHEQLSLDPQTRRVSVCAR